MIGAFAKSEWRRPEYGIAAVLALAHAHLMARLTQGNFLNSYPFISNDGFDWITEGLALKQRIAGVDAGVFPVLRNPVYVLVNALDAALGGRGTVVILATALAIFVTLAAVARQARVFGYGVAVMLLVIVGQYFSVLGFWRLWVLSDTIAGALMAVSFVGVIAAVQTPTRMGLVLSAVLAVAAGLTQTYGIIPFVIVSAVTGAGVWRTDRSASVVWGIAAAGVLIATFALQRLWAALLPHAMAPAQFELLQPSFAMAGFYFNVWTMTFGCFAPVVVMALWRRWRTRAVYTSVELAIGAVLAAFAVLAFFYQWPESRFTFIFLPVFFIALLALGAPKEGRRLETPMGWACAMSAVIGLTLAPINLFSPVLQGAQVNWAQAWPGQALSARPLDRFAVREHCPNWRVICDAAPLPVDGDAYRQNMYLEYQRRERLEGK